MTKSLHLFKVVSLIDDQLLSPLMIVDGMEFVYHPLHWQTAKMGGFFTFWHDGPAIEMVKDMPDRNLQIWHALGQEQIETPPYIPGAARLPRTYKAFWDDWISHGWMSHREIPVSSTRVCIVRKLRLTRPYVLDLQDRAMD